MLKSQSMYPFYQIAGLGVIGACLDETSFEQFKRFVTMLEQFDSAGLAVLKRIIALKMVDEDAGYSGDGETIAQKILRICNNASGSGVEWYNSIVDALAIEFVDYQHLVVQKGFSNGLAMSLRGNSFGRRMQNSHFLQTLKTMRQIFDTGKWSVVMGKNGEHMELASRMQVCK